MNGMRKNFGTVFFAKGPQIVSLPSLLSELTLKAAATVAFYPVPIEY